MLQADREESEKAAAAAGSTAPGPGGASGAGAGAGGGGRRTGGGGSGRGGSVSEAFSLGGDGEEEEEEDDEEEFSEPGEDALLDDESTLVEVGTRLGCPYGFEPSNDLLCLFFSIFRKIFVAVPGARKDPCPDSTVGALLCFIREAFWHWSQVPARTHQKARRGEASCPAARSCTLGASWPVPKVVACACFCVVGCPSLRPVCLDFPFLPASRRRRCLSRTNCLRPATTQRALARPRGGGGRRSDERRWTPDGNRAAWAAVVAAQERRTRHWRSSEPSRRTYSCRCRPWSTSCTRRRSWLRRRPRRHRPPLAPPRAPPRRR